MEINEGMHWDEIIDVQEREPFHMEPEQMEAIKRWQDRFKIPNGKTKKEYQEILKKTQKEIDYYKERMRRNGPEDTTAEVQKEDWIAKKAKLKKILELHREYGTLSITRAKAYPIQQLLEFNSAGFTACPYHEDRTPSLKWYPQRNKAHCFSCSGDFDSLDIYQIINNVTLPEAIKKLS